MLPTYTNIFGCCCLRQNIKLCWRIVHTCLIGCKNKTRGVFSALEEEYIYSIGGVILYEMFMALSCFYYVITQIREMNLTELSVDFYNFNGLVTVQWK